MKKAGPQIVSCLDGLIHEEVLKRAPFPLNTDVFGNIAMNQEDTAALALLYKEVADEILTQYGFQDE